MSQPSVVCIAASSDRSIRMVRHLRQHKIPGSEISVLFLDRRAPATNASASTLGPTAPAPPESARLRKLVRWITGVGRRVRPGAPLGSAALGAGKLLTIVAVTTTKLALLNALVIGQDDAA